MQSCTLADPSPRTPVVEDHAQMAPRDHVPLDPESAARSVRNIATWRSYLPTACVQAMIRMGWDRST